MPNVAKRKSVAADPRDLIQISRGTHQPRQGSEPAVQTYDRCPQRPECPTAHGAMIGCDAAQTPCESGRQPMVVYGPITDMVAVECVSGVKAAPPPVIDQSETPFVRCSRRGDGRVGKARASCHDAPMRSMQRTVSSRSGPSSIGSDHFTMGEPAGHSMPFGAADRRQERPLPHLARSTLTISPPPKKRRSCGSCLPLLNAARTSGYPGRACWSRPPAGRGPTFATNAGLLPEIGRERRDIVDHLQPRRRIGPRLPPRRR